MNYIGRLKGKIKDLQDEVKKCEDRIQELENDVNYNNKVDFFHFLLTWLFE